MSEQQQNNAQNPSPFVAVAVLLLFLVGGAVAFFAFGGKDHSSGHDKPGRVHNEDGDHAHDEEADHAHEDGDHAHDANAENTGV